MNLPIKILSIQKGTLLDLIVQFYQLWPPFQWISSLLTLILVYWISGYFYNKYLSAQGGWMDAETRAYMIAIDLALNLVVGIYYMGHRDTLIGSLMIQCPVFCSPLFWLVELICFYIYSRYMK